MKTLLISLLLLAAFTAQAQTFTNLTIKVTADIVVTGVSTNSSNTTLNLTASTPKYLLKINGASYIFNLGRVAGFTNTFDNYIAKVIIGDDLKAASDALNRANNQATLDAITKLLTTQLDSLSASDLSSLSAIAAKAQ